MNELIQRINSQPNFPHEDLDAVNAEFFSLMLANAELLANGHAIAERSYPIFIGTHQPLAIAAGNIFNDPDKAKDIDFGIKAFEAITLFVDAGLPRPDLESLEYNINGIVRPSNPDGVQGYFETAHSAFLDEMPRTAGVIRETSERFVGSAALAVLGGAIARQFELDNIL